MAYSSVSIIALVVLLITNYDLLFLRKSFDKVPAQREYRWFVISVAIFFVADLLWGLFEEYNIHGFDHAITVTFFAIMAVSVFLWSLYVARYLAEKKLVSNLLIAAGSLLMISGVAVNIVNFFTPVLFEFVDGVYKALPFRTFYFIAQGIMFLATSIYAFVCPKSTIIDAFDDIPA